MRAHDVRHLTVCKRCGCLGLKPAMIDAGRKVYHCGGCAVIVLGPNAILALPWSERQKFRISDVSPELMRALLSRGKA